MCVYDGALSALKCVLMCDNDGAFKMGEMGGKV